jgi:hypothetical protein
MSETAILPGSPCLGKINPSQYPAFPWDRYRNLSTRNDIGVDATWKLKGIPRLFSKCLQAEFSESTSRWATSFT